MINGEIPNAANKPEVLNQRQSRKNEQMKSGIKKENAVHMLMHHAFIHRQRKKKTKRDNARQRLESSRVMCFMLKKGRRSRIICQVIRPVQGSWDPVTHHQSHQSAS